MRRRVELVDPAHVMELATRANMYAANVTRALAADLSSAVPRGELETAHVQRAIAIAFTTGYGAGCEAALTPRRTVRK